MGYPRGGSSPPFGIYYTSSHSLVNIVAFLLVWSDMPGILKGPGMFVSFEGMVGREALKALKKMSGRKQDQADIDALEALERLQEE